MLIILVFSGQCLDFSCLNPLISCIVFWYQLAVLFDLNFGLILILSFFFFFYPVTGMDHW